MEYIICFTLLVTIIIVAIKKQPPLQPRKLRDGYFCLFFFRLTAFNGFPCVLIIYYAKSNVNISLEFYTAENIGAVTELSDTAFFI